MSDNASDIIAKALGGKSQTRLLYDFAGLVTAPGLLARSPASCISIANFRFPQPGIMRKRVGFALGAQTAGVNECFTSLMSTPGTNDLFFAMGGGSGRQALYYGSPSTAWSTLTDTATTATNGGGRKARIATSGGASYICNFGIRRIEGTTSFRMAGMPRGLAPFTYSMNAAVYSVLSGAGGYLADGANAAYRVTYHLKANGVELGGPPTSRLVVRNIAGTSGYAAATTQKVTLRIPLPYEVGSATVQASTSFYWRLWRSRSMTGADTADDEMYQIAEAFFTATDITNGYAVVTDQTPDTFMTGAPRLNTNSSNFPPLEAGLANGQTHADEAPPAGVQDMCEFANCMFYADPFVRAALNIKLISASFTAGNTVTINGQVCTAVAGVPVNPGDFTIVTGLSSLSLNIEATARNLVDAYNRTSARATASAHYISQGTQDPGQILIEEQGTLGVVTVSSATAGALFSPNITTAKSGVSDSKPNSLFYSKPGRPDAVPPVNVLTVGPSNSVIMRIIVFRERLLCFTTAGIYEVNGTSFNNFTVSLLDSTARLFQQESVCIQEDACYAWCYSGIVEITDGGTTVISDVIESLIQSIFTQTFGLSGGTQFGDAFAVADKTNHIVYFFYTLGGSGQANCARWLEFDARTRKWSAGSTTDATGRSCGEVQQSSGLLVLGNAAANQFSPSGVAKCFIQRNARNATDYQDDTPAGVSQAIISSVIFQLQTPDPNARQHWQQLLLHFEDNETSWWSRPTGIGLSWFTDPAGAVGGVSVSLSSPIMRVETPALARRATRQQVTLTHSLAENCGLIALDQSLRADPSRFPR